MVSWYLVVLQPFNLITVNTKNKASISAFSMDGIQDQEIVATEATTNEESVNLTLKMDQ